MQVGGGKVIYLFKIFLRSRWKIQKVHFELQRFDLAGAGVNRKVLSLISGTAHVFRGTIRIGQNVFSLSCCEKHKKE
jgi:hypothetical protein